MQPGKPGPGHEPQLAQRRMKADICWVLTMQQGVLGRPLPALTHVKRGNTPKKKKILMGTYRSGSIYSPQVTVKTLRFTEVREPPKVTEVVKGTKT